MKHETMAVFRRQPRFERLVSLFDRDEIGDAVDALIAYMDAKAPDPDLEDSEAGNERVNARGRYLFKPGIYDDEDHEPDVDDEPDNEDRCEARDDDPAHLAGDFRPGDPDDAEDSHDIELNGDEGDCSEGPPWEN